jgi:hypothetical protein
VWQGRQINKIQARSARERGGISYDGGGSWTRNTRSADTAKAQLRDTAFVHRRVACVSAPTKLSAYPQHYSRRGFDELTYRIPQRVRAAGFRVAPQTKEEMKMKVLSLALVASFAIVGNTYAQTAPPAAASAPATSSSSSSSVSHDCKKEASKLCGRHAGSEMQACIKSNLDLNKFSAACATEFKNAAAAKKPAS